MSLIQCPDCSASFKVRPEVVGRKVDCPKCSSAFTAASQRAGSSRARTRKATPKTSSTPYILAGVGVVAFGALMFMMGSGDDNSNSNASAGKTSSALSRGAGDSGPQAAPSSDQGAELSREELRDRVDRILLAIQSGDDAKIRGQVNFPAFQDRLSSTQQDSPAWKDVPALDKESTRAKIVTFIMGDSERQDFLQRADLAPSDYTVVRTRPRYAEVYMVHRGTGDESTMQQERTLELTTTGSSQNWMVSWLHTSDTYDISEKRESDQAMASAEAAEERAERAEAQADTIRRNYGNIEVVDHLADTPQDRRAELDQLATKLTDLSLTREMSKAKRALVKAGKAAIPSLLNIIARRKELAGAEDVMVVNQVVQALTQITHLDGFGFAPSNNSGSMAGATSAEDNHDALRQWFGWWQKNKNSWTGPETSSDEDEG